MRNLWEVWKMNKSDLLMTLGSMLAGSLFGSIMVAVIMWFADADSYAVMGSMIALVIWLAIIVFTGAFSLEKRFSMAVGLGETRKSFIASQFIIMAVNTLIELLFVIMLNALEKNLGAMIYKLPCEFDVVTGLFNVRRAALIVILVPVVSMFFGMLIIKFQRKAFWGIWVLWMLGSFGSSRVIQQAAHNPNGILARMIKSVVNLMEALGANGVLLCGLLLALVLLSITVAVLRKQPVTQF